MTKCNNIDTVKKSNLVIKNYLTEKDLWNCAMEDLFINNIRLSDVKYKQKIGDTILGNCPNCGDKLKRDSEFFIVCSSYPDCDFSCIDDYYYDHILILNSERESISSESNSKIKNENIANDNINSNPISISNYNKNKINNQEKIQNDAKLNKSRIHNKVDIVNSTNNKNLNYCSNCGCSIELEEEYCANCGEKISRTPINQQKLKSTQKRNWGDIIGVIMLVIIIVLFIFYIVIMKSDIGGSISTIAAAIFILVVCFFCYVNMEGK